MLQVQEDLIHRIQTLEKELKILMEGKQREFRYRWDKGTATFEKEAVDEHRKLKSGLVSYIAGSRIMAVLTAPIIYFGIIPFGFVDLFLAVYQATCFRTYGIPKVQRGDYLIFDRGQLKYLNFLERLNCVYCSYVNGLCAYGTEVVARTEQHWCPIKHARRLRAPHSRYSHFFDYGNADRYSREIEAVRSDFTDLNRAPANPSESQKNSRN